MKFPILYTFRRCPYAIRARMALAYAGIKFELREVVLKKKPQEMLKLSPKGTVPVLQLTDGRVLEESLEIMHWALAESGFKLWLPEDLKKSIDALIAENDQSFKKALDAYKYPRKHLEKSRVEWRGQGMVFLQKLERLLGDSAYLLGDQICLADVALFPFVRQFAGVDPDWFASQETLKKLNLWLKKLLNHPLFLAVMQKYPPWSPGEAPTYFEFKKDS
ncbi:MAG: glutathione S-transferase N-terminal domain-containing protein [Deltaproteobacteria bacterium]|nr:glutathione S-transferase N-terminal domain-containing protein [Deltaproteobacteria bacterium]